jgi:predicted sulfurtransferase
VGSEIIATCHLCNKTKCDTHHHCANQICNVLFIGCEDCIEKGQGYCGALCRLTDKLPAKPKKVYARYYNKFIRKRQDFAKTRLAGA